MDDIFDFFNKPKAASSDEVDALKRAAAAADFAKVGTLFLAVLRMEERDALAASVQLDGGRALATAFAEALSGADGEPSRWHIWSSLRLDDPTRGEELRAAIDECARSTGASEAAWQGLGVHVLREAVASEDANVLLDAGRQAVAHVQRNLGWGHELCVLAAFTVLDAYLASEHLSHWEEAERLARTLEGHGEADGETRGRAALELGFALAVQHRWAEAAAAWSRVPLSASRPRVRSSIDRHRLAGDVHGVVSRARLDISMSMMGAPVAPVVARCAYELAELEGLEDAVTPEGARCLRRHATSRVEAWLAHAELGPDIVDELVEVARIENHTSAREEVLALVAKLDEEVRSAFDERLADVRAEMLHVLAANAGNNALCRDVDFADDSAKGFRRALRLEGLAAEEAAMMRLFEPRIDLVERADEPRRSRLGGPPELPDGFSFRGGPDEPALEQLRLVALLDLAELHGTGIRTMALFPAKGTLAFFFAPGATTRCVGRVLYAPSDVVLRTRADLAHVPAVPIALEGRSSERLPPLGTPFYAALLACETGDLHESARDRVQGVALPWGYAPTYRGDADDEPARHHFGGYADAFACDPYAAAVLGAARPPASAANLAVAREASSWRALLHLDARGSSLGIFEEPGILSFLIRDDDLAACRFEEAWAVWQPDGGE